jgi:multicomponent Na+:H+ antiporter subunit D
MIPLSFYSIPLLMASAFMIVAIGSRRDKYVQYVALFATLATAALSIATAFQLANGGALTLQVSGWPAPFGITIVVDPLSIVFMVLVSAISFLTTLFSQSYIKHNRTEYYALTCLVLTGLLGIIHTGDIFNMFVFFEIMSISSYALVAFYRNRKALEASIKYLVMGALATSLILLGVTFLYGAFGTLNMADIAVKASGYSGILLPLAIAFLLTGFSLKSGLFPFHTWIPDAHPAAPSPVSALLSGLVIKGGIYCIIRVGFTVLGAPAVLLSALTVIGVLSMVIGGALAFVQTDLKRLLAYSSISQMGYIAMALGLNTQIAISGAIFHVINHAIIKSLLFLCAGVIIYYAKTSDMHKIAGTIKSNTLLTYSFLIGALSLGGVPFLNGFASKWLIYVAALQASPLLAVFALLITVMTLAYGLRAFYMIFMSNPNPGAKQVKIPLAMAIPLVILACACVVLGLLPVLGYYISDFAMAGLSSSAYVGAVLG